MTGDRYRTMGAGEIADLLDKNELEGRDYFNCVYRAMSLLREQAQTEAAKPAVPDDLVDLLRELRPNYGDVGSRDVDVTEKQRKIDAAIAMLSAAPPLPVAQGAEPVNVVAWLVEHDDSTPVYGKKRYTTLANANSPDFWVHGRIAEGAKITALVPVSYLTAMSDFADMIDPNAPHNRRGYVEAGNSAPTPPAAPKEPTDD